MSDLYRLIEELKTNATLVDEVAKNLIDKRQVDMTLLITALGDYNTLVKKSILWFLGEAGTKQATNLLITTLQNDEDYEMRAVAAYALGQLKNERSIEALIEALGYEGWVVRNNAARAFNQSVR